MSAAPQHPQEPTPDDPAPERVATELAAVLGRLSRRMRTVRPAGPLTPSQRSVLARLDESGRPPRRRWPAPSSYARSRCGRPSGRWRNGAW